MAEILTTQMMRESDRRAINGNEENSRALMRLAAQGVYKSVVWQGNIGIVCGNGNNGGDGYALALILLENNIKSNIIMAKGEPKSNTAAHYYYEKCIQNKIPIYTNEESLEKYDILVDAIFGTGFSGDITGELADLICAYNKTKATKISIDINSGLNGDTGMGGVIARSDITVSIGSYKPGHFLNMAKDYIGSLVNCDIGIEPIDSIGELFNEEMARELLPKRPSFSYKGTYGYASIIGGMLEYTGAMKLAATAASAVRSGAGIVRVCVPRSIAPYIAPHIMESTLYIMSEADGVISYNFDEIDYIIKNSSAIAYGMGTTVNDDGVKIIEHILREFDGALILDAGGIRCLSQIDENAIKNKRASLVITPHIGEIKAIYKEYKNPLDAINLAKKIDATVLLKGPTTVITNGQSAYFVTRGCSGMATGGSGDVLSGIICALCGYIKDPLKASALGAYINGMAGEMAMDDLCDISMSAYDTALNVARAITIIKK